jgi:hypothetical protein
MNRFLGSTSSWERGLDIVSLLDDNLKPVVVVGKVRNPVLLKGMAWKCLRTMYRASQGWWACIKNFGGHAYDVCDRWEKLDPLWWASRREKEAPVFRRHQAYYRLKRK